MKNLLVIALVALMVGGAVAQTDYNYAGCEYRLGVFFSASDEEFVLPSNEGTNIDFTNFVIFHVHLVIMDAPDMISAYEMSVEGDFSGFNLAWIPIAGSGYINIGGALNHIATFGFPQPNPDGVVKLGYWTAFPFVDGAAAQFVLGPSEPSSIQGDGPALVINGELVRMNFTPTDAVVDPDDPEFGDYSGCEEDLPPGVFPPYVATTYGEGVIIDEIVATQNRSLSSVKALFQ